MYLIEDIYKEWSASCNKMRYCCHVAYILDGRMVVEYVLGWSFAEVEERIITMMAALFPSSYPRFGREETDIGAVLEKK